MVVKEEAAARAVTTDVAMIAVVAVGTIATGVTMIAVVAAAVARCAALETGTVQAVGT